MADEDINAQEAAVHGADRDLVLDLNFVPNWARKPPSSGQYRAFDDDDERGGGDRGRRREGRRPGGPRPGGGGDRERSRGDGGRGGPRPDGRRDSRDRGEGRPRAPSGAEAGRSERPERPERRPDDFRESIELPPVTVRFLPEQRQLAALIRQIGVSRRAYPLMDLAVLLLNQPNGCFVRFQVEAGAHDLFLYECKLCHFLALDHDEARRHVLQGHVDDFLVKETVQRDPATGNFVCVAKCGMSGALLGPPNHHSYAEAVREVHAARYATLPMEEYRARIVMSHAPEDIERWKQESSVQTVYRLKNGGETAAAMTWGEAEAYLNEHGVGDTIARAKRAVVPEEIARKIADRGLRAVIRSEWQHEHAFPLQLSFALRAAFRHKRMFLFKAGAGRGINFVTAIQPAPLDPAHAIDSIHDVLTCLRDHPGYTREQLVESLRPGADMASDEVKTLLAPLYWLIDRGHIIEFFNGTLSVPLGKHHDATRGGTAPETESESADGA